MKLGMDIFCASPASTAICSSIDQRSMVRRSLHRNSTDHHQQSPCNLLDHHDHHRRMIKNQQPRHHHVPCSSQLPINPRPYNYEKSRKSCSDNYSYKQTSEVRRKSSADVYDMKSISRTSPPGSSRYLLSETPFVDWLSSETDDDRAVQRHVVSADHHDDHDQPAKLKFRSLSTNDRSSSLRASSSTRSRHQVFVLLRLVCTN